MDNINPFVSVIIPNYNHARFLDQRIQSVLDQTYQNFEVIILDDASPDEGASRAIIEKYRNNSHVSHVVYNDINSGSTFKQWRKGLALAKGELIWIAESDDYCETEFLSKLILICKTFPNASIIQSDSHKVDVNGKIIDEQTIYTGEIIGEDGTDCITNHLICSNFYISNASAVLFRKDRADVVPQDFVKYKASGDRLFWIYLAERGDVVKLNKPLNYFRQHGNKVSSINEFNGIQCRENYAINQYLHEKGLIRRNYRLIEFNYYWNYINKFQFESDEIKNELLELWFGYRCYKKYIFRLIQNLLNCKVRIYQLFHL